MRHDNLDQPVFKEEAIQAIKSASIDEDYIFPSITNNRHCVVVRKLDLPIIYSLSNYILLDEETTEITINQIRRYQEEISDLEDEEMDPDTAASVQNIMDNL
jgi:hypothetical protein